jgi:hypothetical protein
MCRCVAVSAPTAVLEVATESDFTIYLSVLLAKTINRLRTVSYRWQLYAVEGVTVGTRSNLHVPLCDCFSPDCCA